jgi:hypothetical protein
MARDNLLLSSELIPPKMTFTSLNSNGEILTGKLWRKDLSFFSNLPFHSNILRMDDIAESLVGALDDHNGDEFCNGLLLVRFYSYFPFPI